MQCARRGAGKGGKANKGGKARGDIAGKGKDVGKIGVQISLKARDTANPRRQPGHNLERAHGKVKAEAT